MSSENSTKNRKDHFSLIYKFIQCIFCLENEHRSYVKCVYKYIKLNKIMNEMKKHLINYSFKNQILCLHSQCKAAILILLNVMTFKAHTAKMHQIYLQDPAQC